MLEAIDGRGLGQWRAGAFCEYLGYLDERRESKVDVVPQIMLEKIGLAK